MIRFKELVDFIERRAPFSLQESWDNSGVWLELSDKVEAVAVALEIEHFDGGIFEEADVLIVHHPPFLKREAEMSGAQKKVFDMARNGGKNLIVMHTNADACRDSFVDLVLRKASIENSCPFKEAYLQRAKVVVFVPEETVDPIIDFLKLQNLSNVGFYKACAFLTDGKGHFCPVEGATPYISFSDDCGTAKEIRLEFEVPFEDVDYTVTKIAALHPYEEPVIDVYTVKRFVKGAGIGRVFESQKSTRELIETFVELGIKVEDVIIVKEMAGKTVFVPGSGRNFAQDVIKFCADTFISGDLSYHDKKNLSQHGINLIEVNHASVESFFVEWLEDELNRYFGDRLKILRREHENN